MRFYIFLFIVSISFLACNSEKKEFAKVIADLEAQLESSPANSSAGDLFSKYDEYINKFPNDKEWGGRYKYRAASLQFAARNYKQAADACKEVMDKFSTSSAAPNAALLRASIYEDKFNSEAEVRTSYQFIVDNYPNHEAAEKANFFFKPPKERLGIEIADLEKDLYLDEGKTRLNNQVVAKLIRKYRDYSQKVNDDPNGCVSNLIKASDLLAKSSNFAASAQVLEGLEERFATATNLPDAMLQLAEVQEEDLGDSEAATKTANQLLEKYPNYKRAEEVKFYLKPANEKVNNRIALLEEKIYGDSLATRIDVRLANRLVKKYEQFAKLNPKDSKTPDYLFKGGELAQSTKNFSKALELWQEVHNNYKSSKRAPQSLFLQGYLYENEFRDLKKAEETYKAFIKKYPTNGFADDAKFSLDNLGKTPDEIIKSFDEKAKANAGK